MQLFHTFLWFADDESVRRSATRVAEAENANYIGLVMLLVAVVPFGVVISLDLSTFVEWMLQRSEPRHKHRRPGKTRRER